MNIEFWLFGRYNNTWKGRSLNTLLRYFRQKILTVFGQQRGRRMNQGRPGAGGGTVVEYQNTWNKPSNITKIILKLV